MGFYVESADRPYQSRLAAEDVHVGELVNENGSDKFERTNGADHSYIQALAVKHRLGDWVAEDDEDSTNFTYDAADDDRVIAQPLSDGDVVKVRSAEDTGGNESAPSVSDGDVVGVIDTSAGTLSSTTEYEGRVVQEGYTDGESTPTTYNRTNDNFIPLGVAYKDEVTSYDHPVRIQVENNL